MVTDVMHYLNFVMMVFFAFGLCFEIPVIQMVLAAVGIADLQKLKRWRRYAIVGACVVAPAVIPPDITSILLLGIPTYFLFEIGIITVRVLVKPRSALDAAAQASG